ncbi:MAG: hypothetical protein HYU02_05740 [Thaumarchaeota archaeon]|nr:hypothetical protein [Nitrososphaerota archaeon]
MIRLEHSKFVRAPKQSVYDWWTDFQETDPSLSGRIIRRRKMVSKSPAEVIYEDEGRMLGVSYKDRVRVRLFPPDKWIAEYHSSKLDATSTYSLKEVDGGTQLDVATEVEFEGWLRPFGGLAKWG